LSFSQNDLQKTDRYPSNSS